jgi:hypothetical protein
MPHAVSCRLSTSIITVGPLIFTKYLGQIEMVKKCGLGATLIVDDQHITNTV